MGNDPIAIADVLLDAASAARAELVVIDVAAEGLHAVEVQRAGETLARASIDSALAASVIARLGYICHVDPTSRRGGTGRTRIRTGDAQCDVILTLRAGDEPRAELRLVQTLSSERAEITIGDHVGHYRVTRAIGAGGMGSVYEVVHEKLGRKHALKVLQHWVLDRGDESIQRFLAEAQAAARIRNEHIVEVFDFGYLADRRPYIVMELLAGRSLADELAAQPLSLARTLSFARQLARALTAAHERDVIHADVTPSNVIVSDQDHLTLIDFGLAQLRSEVDTNARAEQVSGTPSYLAPERIAGFAADAATDQYAFGAVVFELLTGAPPFRGPTPRAICLGHLHEPIPRVPGPPALEQVIRRCLAKQPGARHRSMRDVLDALVAIACTTQEMAQ